MLGEWLESLGRDLEDVSLDFVLEHHGPTSGEMVPTGSGEVEGGPEDFRAPGVIHRDGRWEHEGGFGGGGGRRGRHSADFVPLWEEMTNMYRSFPGAKW